MNLPFYPDYRSYHHTKRTLFIGNSLNRVSIRNCHKLRKYAKLFEKKLLKINLKDNQGNSNSLAQKKVEEKSDAICIDASIATFYQIKSSLSATIGSTYFTDTSWPAQDATDSDFSPYPSQYSDPSYIRPTKSTVIFFGFLSKLEVYIEHYGNVISVCWVAGTRIAYLFLITKMKKFCNFLQQRFKKKIVTNTKYKNTYRSTGNE